MSTPLDARAARSRSALISAGIELLAQDPGATLTEVATHAGVGRATLYRHFDCREQLIQSIAVESLEMTDHVLAPIRARADALSAQEMIEQGLRVIVPLADRYHFLFSLWRVADDDPVVGEIYQRQLGELAAMIERGKAEGSISKRLDTHWVMHIYDYILHTCWILVGQQRLSAEEAAEHAIATFFDGVGNSP